MRYLATAAALVVAAIAAVPLQPVVPQLAAQQLAADCEKCQDDSISGPHSFTQIGGGAFFACAPNTCHLEWMDGRCSEFHNSCGDTLLEQELEALAVALESGEASAVRSAMAGFEDARVHLAVGAVDIQCAGRLVARVDVPAHRVRWLAAVKRATAGPAGL